MHFYSDRIQSHRHIVLGKFYYAAQFCVITHLKERIQNASKVPTEAVRMNRTLVRDGVFDFADMQALISRRKTTPQNRAAMLERLQTALTSGDFGEHFGPCEGVHPWINYCRNVPLDRFIAVFRWMFPIYGALHLVPAMLFKRKVFWQDPWKVILRAAWGTTRSSTFLGVFVVIYQSMFPPLFS